MLFLVVIGIISKFAKRTNTTNTMKEIYLAGGCFFDKNPDGYCHLPTALFEYARKAKDIK